MRNIFLLGTLVAGFAMPLGAAESVLPLTSAQKVLVWAQAKDPGIAEGIEFTLQGLLADRQMISERYSKVFPQTAAHSPQECISTLKQLKIDDVIVFVPAGNIQWAKDKPTEGISTLKQFLAKSPGDLHPVALAPPSSLSEPAPGVSVPARGPIPGNQGPVGQQIIKVGALIYDVTTGKLIWQGKFPVRAPAEMPMNDFQKRVSEEAIAALEKAGLLPHRR